MLIRPHEVYPMDVLDDSQLYATAAITYAIGADRPWGGSVAASSRVPMAEGEVCPELGAFIRLDVSVLAGYRASFGPVVGIMSAERADSRYRPYAQADLAAGLQLGNGPPTALVDLGVAKALNPYVTAPQTHTHTGLDFLSVRADAAFTLGLTRDSANDAPDPGAPAWSGPNHPVQLGLGIQGALLPLEWLLAM